MELHKVNDFWNYKAGKRVIFSISTYYEKVWGKEGEGEESNKM